MNKVYQTILSVTAATLVAGATLIPTAVNAWGDSDNGRPSYTIEQINNGDLGQTITFNSISNNPKIGGDEKDFVGAKLSSNDGAKWSNDITVKDGEVYTIRLYVHNNSPLDVEKIAEDVSVRFSLPMEIGKKHTVVGYLNASNAKPTTYWDEVNFVSSDDFYLEYVHDSAKYTNDKIKTVALPNEVITSGTAIGYEGLDGKIPGCFLYDGSVTIQVKVHQASRLSKTVRIKGTTNWQESVNAKIGDEVEFQIEYENLSNQDAMGVIIRDTLPANMEYVANSTYLYNANYQSGVQVVENTVTTTGINIGNYAANGGNAFVRFTAKVVNKSLACGDNKLVNWASSTVDSRVIKDDASVMVNRICEVPEEPQTPPEMPSTGATDVVAGALGAGAVVTLAGYLIASRKK